MTDELSEAGVRLFSVTHELLERSGWRYEDRYGGYMDFFKQVSDAIKSNDGRVHVYRPPWSWVPLLRYIGASVERPVFFDGFIEADRIVEATLHRLGYEDLSRSAIETLCALRPETIDALWKVDRQWGVRALGAPSSKKEFIVTGNGSFDRPEIRAYEGELARYKPTKKKVVLVPCAADKPYPSRMHQAVLDLMPDDFYLANITGVLGIVPMDLWDVMPHYDSGIPNEWRCMNIVEDYFSRNAHTQIISFCDFYNRAIRHGLTHADVGGPKTDIIFVNPVQFYADYVDLLAPDRLAALKHAFDIMRVADGKLT